MNGASAIVRDGGRWLEALDPVAAVRADGPDAFAALDTIASGGFWAGFCAYDLGRSIEPVPDRAADDLGLPDLAFVRFANVREIAAPSGPPVGLGEARSSLDRARHAAAVEIVHELLRAGECYQVNLTRRLEFATSPDPRALFAALTARNPAPHAALCVLGDTVPGVAIVSASPELYLGIDGDTVTTRPIKGTAADAGTLAGSAKDRAEHVMIVDLARNDLGRICRPGTIRVPDLSAIEAHPGLHHMVSTVTGERRSGVGLGEVVRATFPPASVTGAPKPRVLRAIEELEPVRRGAYCGAVGWIDGDAGRARLSVAIRTFTVTPNGTTLGVGGGIVADSDADAEWAETELKAARLLAAVGGREREPVPA
ncbi:MAG: anthranilate synthase component I family protein [Actinomycetota bacterium]